MKVDVDQKRMRERMPYRCGKCRRKAKLNQTHDAYYCSRCNRWTEPACSDAGCESCYARPAKPLKRRARA